MIWRCYETFHGMPEGACAGGIAVVIDVLRASTTIATALFHGAVDVLPTVSLDEARTAAARLGAVLGGERGGERVEGFDLGNSPAEYTAARVAGRTVVITTTNGTAALHAAAAARQVFVGAIVNRAAVAAAIRQAAAEGAAAVHLVCAGTDGLVSAEDMLAAGAILDAAAAPGDVLDAVAQEARGSFRRVAATGDAPAALVAEFRRSPGGANLVALGMEADLPAAAAIDTLPVAPVLDRGTGRLSCGLLHSRP